MAVRVIRLEDDEVLRKRSKEVELITDKVLTLLDDMAETMYKADGVGLAAPQVGVLKRIVVIDVGEGLIELINPILVQQSGEQYETEGCLSVPEVTGTVKRPMVVVVDAVNREGKPFRIEGRGLLARALCHEMDHLDGVLFTDKVIKYTERKS